MHASGRRLLASAVCCGAALIGAAHAQTPTATIGVRAYVPPACAASTLDYGVLDFGSHGSLSNQIQMTSTVGAGTIRVTCVQGLSYSIELDDGLNAEGTQRYMRSVSGGRIRYQLFSDSQFSVPWANDTPINQVGTGEVQQIPLYGRVPPQDTPGVGIYRDTVSVTVQW